MIDIHFGSDLFLAWMAYFLLTISPGPAVLAIINGSASAGRRAGLAVALGVLMGSLFWGVLAAMGLSSVLTHCPVITNGLRIAGSLFLFWLAAKAARSAMSAQDMKQTAAYSRSGVLGFFVKGLLIHLTNPKAIFGWMAIIAIGVSPDSATYTSMWTIFGCFVLGILVFCGYALLFSLEKVRVGYSGIRRYVDSRVAAVFGYAGLKLLLYKD